MNRAYTFWSRPGTVRMPRQLLLPFSAAPPQTLGSRERAWDTCSCLGIYEGAGA